MPRYRQYSQLTSDLRAELGLTNDPSVRAANLPSIQQSLNRAYETLYEEHNWPHLRVVADRIALSAGQRLYDFPANLDFDRIESVGVWWSGQPRPITRGIGFPEYATYDSESDVRGDPVLKWDIRASTTSEQFEVWPVPASDDQEIQFIGTQKFALLVDDSDICYLDSNLVVLTAAVGLLARAKHADAKLALASAQRRLDRLKGRQASEATTYRIGLGQAPQEASSKSTVIISGV